MTRAAEFIYDLETAPGQAERDSILRRAKDDRTFASIARMTFDPFMQWRRTASALPPIPDGAQLAAIGHALDREWSYVAGWLESKQNTHVTDDELKSWRGSKAWPIYARVLSKRFDTEGITREIIAGATGTVPLWFVGSIVRAEEVEYPVGVQPFIRGTRCVAMVSQPFVFGTDVWFLGKFGLPFPVPVPSNIRDAILNTDFSGLPHDFHYGVVLDGVVNMAGYTVFDIVPLDLFREQARTEFFETRAEQLLSLQFADPIHTVPTIRVKDREELADTVGKLRRNGFDHAVVKALRDPYPYFAGHYGTPSWVRADTVLRK